jgi:hypothetical protein
MYHGLNGIVGDSGVVCVDCGFKRYATLENLKRVCRAIKGKQDYDLPNELARKDSKFRLNEVTRSHEWVDFKHARTIRDAFEYGVWRGLLIDDSREQVGYIDDYNSVWESPDELQCEDCNTVLSTIITHATESDLSCYGMVCCICEDCVIAWASANIDTREDVTSCYDTEHNRELMLSEAYAACDS